MKSLPTFVATALLSASIALPVQVLAQDRIAVATLDGNSIWLDEIMAVAETLPPEYQQQGIAGIYDQLVDEVANSRLAAVAARSSGLDKEADVASAMKTAADRVLAEAYITREVSKEITEESIQAAYDTYVADTGSRETVTASHILVETEDEARAIIAQLKPAPILPSLRARNRLVLAGRTAARSAPSVVARWCPASKQLRSACRPEASLPTRCRPSSAGM